MMKRHQTMSVVLAVVFAALNAASVVAAVNFPVGTHLIKGTLKDWQNKVLTSSAAVDGYNFLLQIPLSSTATDSTAAVGDTLNCVLVQDSGLSLAASPLVVGEANAVSTVSLAYVNMKNYTSTDGTGTTASVPAEYVETIAAWMEAYEIEGDYDPFADYDNDGASNYAEYRAGTNPFDASDKLAITAYSAPQNDQLRVRRRTRLRRRHHALAHKSPVGDAEGQEDRDGRRARAGDAVRRRG